MADVLAGKVALVTGASSGLGRAVTEILHRRGAEVFGIAREKEKLRQSMVEVVGADGERRFAATDVSDSAQCDAAVQACVDELGGIDILVNVAGSHSLRHTADIADSEWAHDLAVNLNGPFFLSRAALPHLLERGGNIVNVSSIAGLEGRRTRLDTVLPSTDSSD